MPAQPEQPQHEGRRRREPSRAFAPGHERAIGGKRPRHPADPRGDRPGRERQRNAERRRDGAAGELQQAKARPASSPPTASPPNAGGRASRRSWPRAPGACRASAISVDACASASGRRSVAAPAFAAHGLDRQQGDVGERRRGGVSIERGGEQQQRIRARGLAGGIRGTCTFPPNGAARRAPQGASALIGQCCCPAEVVSRVSEPSTRSKAHSRGIGPAPSGASSTYRLTKGRSSASVASMALLSTSKSPKPSRCCSRSSARRACVSLSGARNAVRVRARASVSACGNRERSAGGFAFAAPAQPLAHDRLREPAMRRAKRGSTGFGKPRTASATFAKRRSRPASSTATRSNHGSSRADDDDDQRDLDHVRPRGPASRDRLTPGSWRDAEGHGRPFVRQQRTTRSRRRGGSSPQRA